MSEARSVWIVVYENWDVYEIHGIFSTEEKAAAYLADWRRRHGPSAQWAPGIEEHPLDAPTDPQAWRLETQAAGGGG